MAEVDTNMLSREHSDIRHEQAEQAAIIRQQNADRSSEIRYDVAQGVNEVVKEGLKGDFNTVGSIKDARYETVSRVEGAADRIDAAITNANFNLSSRVENAQDRNAKEIGDLRSSVSDRLYTIGRESADNRAQITALGFQVRDGFTQAAAVMENAVLRNEIAGHKNTTYLSDKIGNEGDKTRALINELKYHDLSRSLVERNAELVEERHFGRHWRHAADQSMVGGQFAQLQSQMQNFNSQLNETRQGMINFGTMAGVGQSSTSNNVR